jgi:DNA repair protein RecO (recombination protein O)
MALGRTAAVVIGRFPLGERDLVATFFTRRHGTVRGVARGARGLTSRFAGALELFTLGDLLFFDGGRSSLVQVDHFDIRRPFARARDDLERLGQAAWMAECVGRLTAERDPNPAVFGLLVRGLESLEAGAVPARVAAVFGVRCVDALGHRLRIEACLRCGRALGRPEAALTLDVEGGGVVCARCPGPVPGGFPVTVPALAALRRLRVSAWGEAVAGGGDGVDVEVRRVLDAQVAHLLGRPTHASRFLREVARMVPRSDPTATGVAGGPR